MPTLGQARLQDPELPLPPVRQTAAQLTVAAYAASDSGKRLVNEDSYLCQVNPRTPSWLSGLFIVADGIGGRQNGQIASALAVRAARDVILGTDRFFTPAAVRDLLSEAFNQANVAVYRASKADPSLFEMGTTLVIGAVAQRRLFVASLGDSRAYLHRGRRLVRLTRDDWVRTSSEPLLGDPPQTLSQVITVVNTAVGWGEDPMPQLLDVEVGDGDLLLFCSDGLTDGMSERQIEEALFRHHKRLDLVVRRLIDGGKRASDADNVTVVVVRIDRA